MSPAAARSQREPIQQMDVVAVRRVRDAHLRALPRPRPKRPLSARVLAAGPDRLAMWAVMLGVFMVGLAAATAQAGDDAPSPERSAPQPPALTPHSK